jgi:N-acetylmuramoyl-L-alanine amidase
VWRGTAAVLCLFAACYAQGRVHRSEAWANSQFAGANHLQETLESRPVASRTRSDYQRVIEAYHRVFFEAPSSTKADPSVMAGAQLLEEMGRRFNDNDVLRSAIEQYEFLRREYPGSKARFDALFRIGEIYRDDLHDKAKADATFEEFARRYPRNPLAEEARKSLAQPAQQAGIRAKVAPKATKEVQPAAADDDSAQAAKDDDEDESPDDQAASTARVTAVRHWSTPDYTRVAIDLEHGVKYDAQRIDHPDRIFFDLYNTRLDPKLKDKNLDVDDGYLKKIRISQFKPGQTRVVLDLDELTDFKASLLQNPPRLIVDIQNKRPGTAAGAVGAPTVRVAETAERTHPARAQAANREAMGGGESGAEEESSNEKPAKAEAKIADEPVVVNPAKRTVIDNNGVKKTIVDADDDGQTIAKLDVPQIKPAVETTVPRPAPAMNKSSRKSKRKTPVDDPDMREAQPTANGDRSLIRALGLKIGKIVIDPGHGGHDTGTIGPNGLQEKDLVLDVSLRLGKLLEQRLGAPVVYTRRDDTFIPLEDRTAIANQEGADLFVSVHANSSHDPDARGVETYYLNFSSSPDALEVAARENAVSEKSIHELQDLVKKIALKEKIEESHEFASDVQTSLHSGLAVKNPGLRDRGVKKAPFIVLIGANMPSILAEISFVSNPGDEKRLRTPEYRQKIAESLYRGIAKYVNGLSGIKMASKIDKGEGQ